MICFEINLNGNRLCAAGVGDHGILSQYLQWSCVHPDERPPSYEGPDAQVTLSVTGDRGGEQLRWVDFITLAIGDEIRVRVTEVPSADEPSRVTARKQKE